MLVVKLEVWPGGEEAAAYEIGRAEIANVSELAEVSDYVCRVMVDGDETAPHFKVAGHVRRDGAWSLLRKVLNTYFVCGFRGVKGNGYRP